MTEEIMNNEKTVALPSSIATSLPNHRSKIDKTHCLMATPIYKNRQRLSEDFSFGEVA